MRVQPFNPHPASPFQGEGERREARMKKIFWAAVLMFAGNLAIPAAFGQAEKKWKIVLDHEEKFSQPSDYRLAHVVFGKDARGNPIPRIVVAARHVEFRDKSGNVVQKIPYTAYNAATKTETSIYTTRYGKNIAVHITHGYSPGRESWETGEYSIYDENGNKTLRLNPFNEDTRPEPSPSGDYAVGYPNDDMMGPPLFYDAKGTRNEKWARRWYERAKTGFKSGQPVEEWPDMGTADSVNFSPDGKYVAVACDTYGPRGRITITIVYDSNGDKLFQKRGYPLIFSSGGKTLFYSDGTQTSATGIDGHTIWTSTTPFVPEAFSKDGRFLIARKGPAIYKVRMADGRINWKWEGIWAYLNRHDTAGRIVATSNIDFGILAVATAPDLKRIVAIGSRSNDGATFNVLSENIIILNDQGNLIAQKTIDGNVFSTLALPVISNDGSLVAIQENTGLFYFEVH